MTPEPPGCPASATEIARPDRRSALVLRNVTVNGHRTSIRLEPRIWAILAEICRREVCTVHDVCGFVAQRKPPHGSLSSALRVFVLDYFHGSSTEDGHARIGHGQGMFMSQQQNRLQAQDRNADVLDS